ncbi:hypothetical protein [Bacillus phage vB_BtM_BMBsp2]|nr:hypothetical protein [Bacillus phage vB_BtM_BMBsp2]
MNPFENEDLIKISASDLTYHRRGVLYVEKRPYYIVELIKEPNTALYAVVYAVQPGTESNPKKRATPIINNANRFSGETRLGQIANMMFPVKKTTGWKENPPLFVSPVLSGRVATLTGVNEDGFFERTPDRWTSVGGTKKLEHGQPTGVFIGLSTVEWDTVTHIPVDSLVKAMIRNQQTSDFFDLTGK